VEIDLQTDDIYRGGDQTALPRNGFTAVRMSCNERELLPSARKCRMGDGSFNTGETTPQFMDFEYLRKFQAVESGFLKFVGKCSRSSRGSYKTMSGGVDNKSILLWESPKLEKKRILTF